MGVRQLQPLIPNKDGRWYWNYYYYYYYY